MGKAQMLGCWEKSGSHFLEKLIEDFSYPTLHDLFPLLFLFIRFHL